jgi:curli biogenesis system outer membrane secretion channel CsgG
MKVFVAALLVVLVPSSIWAQRIGVLPFEDAANAGPELGDQVAKFIRSELLKNKKYIPKFLQIPKLNDENPAPVDIDKAVELGKKNGVDYVVMGTILEAEVNKSSSGIGGISLLGQSIGTSLQTITASVVIQGDLISVSTGTLIESFRVSGSKTDKSVSADVSTEWGSVNSDKDAGGNTPNAQALRKAVEDLVKQMSQKIQTAGLSSSSRGY